MYLARGLGSLGALFDGPGAALVRPAGEEGDEAEQRVGALDEPVEAGLSETQLLEEHGLVLLGQLAYLLLYLGADGQHLGALGVGYLLHGVIVRVVGERGHAGLVHVRGVDDGLEAQQVAGGDELHVVFGAVVAPRAPALVQVGQEALEHLGLVQELLVPALRGLLRLVYAALDELHVGHDELELDYLDVARGVRAALDVDYVLVVKAAHDVDYRVRAAYVLQEFVAQALALGRALHQARYVHELDDRRGVFLRLIELREEVQPLVRHGDHADVGVYRAEGVVGALRARVGYGVEQRALAHVGQTHYAELHISYLPYLNRVLPSSHRSIIPQPDASLKSILGAQKAQPAVAKLQGTAYCRPAAPHDTLKPK